jgi:hypothetical protein
MAPALADEVSMATAKQVRAITGEAIGGVAPVGHPAEQLTGRAEQGQGLRRAAVRRSQRQPGPGLPPVGR